MFDLKISRRLSVIGLGLSFAAASGCVRETTEQGEHVFQYELWVPGSVLLGGIVAAVAGFFLRKWNTRVGWVLLIGGPFVALGIGPSMFFDRAAVGKDGFELRTGIYGQTVVPRVQFDDISRIRITSETRRTRRGGKSTSVYLNCDKKSGGSVKVSVNNNVSEAAGKLILQEASARGIPVVDESEAP